jgi:hypothetical protein
MSQIVMEPGGKLFSHVLALSFKEKGNILSLMASSEAPLILKVLHISRKLECVGAGPHRNDHKK